MADDIALNRAQRTTLFSLQQIERDSGVSQRRLSFGRKIVDVTDGASQFFQARSLSNRISDTRDRGEQIDQAISALQAFVTGTLSLQRSLEVADGIVDQAGNVLDAASADERQGLTEAFADTLRSFYQIANSLDYNGLNLLVNQNREFNVRFSDRAADQLQISGRNLFTFGEYTLDKGNLFDRDVIGRNGALTFANIVQEVASAGTDANTIVIRGGNTASVINALAFDTGTQRLTADQADITITGATLSVGAGTSASINGGTAGTIGTAPQIYRNVDELVFDAVADDDVTFVDNFDGSYTITGITAATLELGAGTDSGVAAHTAFAGFSAITSTNNGGNALDAISAALDLASRRLATIENYFGSNIALLQERLDFGIAYGNDLTIGRDKIVLADVNSEAAVLTTLRTRNQIGIGALASNAESEQQLLRLLS